MTTLGELERRLDALEALAVRLRKVNNERQLIIEKLADESVLARQEYGSVGPRIDELRSLVQARCDHIERRVDDIDQTMSKILERLDKLEPRRLSTEQDKDGQLTVVKA
jgi:hypothetical protein